MNSSNPLNVYKGSKSLINYYDPSCQPPLPLVEIPVSLNPFAADGVHIYAKMMTFLPAHNVKAMPALNMLQKKAREASNIDTIVEYSSGSTIISMSVISRILYGIEDTRAFLSNKTSEAKLRLMRFFGLKITLFGGPSQPEPSDPRGGIQKAKEMEGSSGRVFNPNQYENKQNYESHQRWTGPQILDQLPEIDVFCTGMGTAGTMTGTGTFLKQNKPNIIRVGVCTAPGDRVPGPRSFALLAPVHFPWRDAVDVVEEVGSRDSYRMSMLLSRQGIVCGPSSGFNLQGLLNYLQNRKNNGTMHDLRARNASGEIHCVFLCCDLPYQYIDEYFEKTDDQDFHPILNKNLIGVDKHRYDESWELSELLITEKLYGSTSGLPDFLPSELRTDHMNGCPTTRLENSACSTIYMTPESSPELGDAPFAKTTCTLQNGTTLLDLRTSSSYARSHPPGATNFPLSSLMETSPSPFSDSNTLELQWRELESLCTPETLQLLEGKTVVFIDYDGDTARVATSVFRARGVEAWSLRGGVKGLATETEIETEMQMETEAEAETASLDGLKGKGPTASVGLGIGNAGSNFLSLQ
ncbi:hypothetical protein EPUS_07992 [Endocarpon pusillum Z07020]|uniref:Rhodanese domain-containing protein n=1 Tax=Endocarpon pusillum (strain Z07020 / HMAS-L-300199) TaxID=1263415 RepID=U1GGL0_ENDPU|nr:uncharacterized protein EPUS_07992 [Endocarpon pusillum Z07020]ERF76812.1 hypothetical protein EPUS_07992 [Endocarpon pusillum Z07020]